MISVTRGRFWPDIASARLINPPGRAPPESTRGRKPPLVAKICRVIGDTPFHNVSLLAERKSIHLIKHFGLCRHTLVAVNEYEALRQIRGLIFRLDTDNTSAGYRIDLPIGLYPWGYAVGVK
jgi:hypothetical protein